MEYECFNFSNFMLISLKDFNLLRAFTMIFLFLKTDLFKITSCNSFINEFHKGEKIM